MQHAVDETPGGTAETSEVGVASDGKPAPDAGPDVVASVEGLRLSRAWPDLPSRAAESLRALLAGNARFCAGRSRHSRGSPSWRRKVAARQEPIATFFGCIDSRVPNELVLDQGLGDLVTVRTAAHILDDAALGSLEFSVHELRVPLILVVGHQRCGAVTAAIGVLEGGVRVPRAIGALIEALRPAVEATRAIDDPEVRVDAAVRWHTRLTVHQLLDRSSVLADAMQAGEVGIVAARYDLCSGEIAPA